MLHCKTILPPILKISWLNEKLHGTRILKYHPTEGLPKKPVADPRDTRDPCPPSQSNFFYFQWRIQDTGCQPLSLGQKNLLFNTIFAKNCMKMREMGSRTPGALFESTNGFHAIFGKKIYHLIGWRPLCADGIPDSGKSWIHHWKPTKMKTKPRSNQWSDYTNHQKKNLLIIHWKWSWFLKVPSHC